MAMEEISKILDSKKSTHKTLITDIRIEADSLKIKNAEIAKQDMEPAINDFELASDVSNYLDNIDGFQGIDPFDSNLNLVNRVDAIIVYIITNPRRFH